LVGDRLAIHNLDGGGLVSCGFWHISRLPRLPIAIFLPLILALLPLLWSRSIGVMFDATPWGS
jgi:hypothetical protein